MQPSERSTTARRRPGRAALGALAALALAATACGVPPPPIDDGGGWALVFGDGFDGPGLHPVWAVPPTSRSEPPTVSESVLTLRSTAANGWEWGIVAAATGPRVAGEPSYPFVAAWQEGYVEARVRFSNDRWAWPAVWLFSTAKAEAWPGEDCSRLSAEWDIVENGIDGGHGSRPANIGSPPWSTGTRATPAGRLLRAPGHPPVRVDADLGRRPVRLAHLGRPVDRGPALHLPGRRPGPLPDAVRLDRPADAPGAQHRIAGGLRRVPAPAARAGDAGGLGARVAADLTGAILGRRQRRSSDWGMR